MRRMIALDDNVAAAVEQFRQERSMGVNEAINELIHAGLTARNGTRRRFSQRTHSMSIAVDVTCVGKALEVLEERDQLPPL